MSTENPLRTCPICGVVSRDVGTPQSKKCRACQQHDF